MMNDGGKKMTKKRVKYMVQSWQVGHFCLFFSRVMEFEKKIF